MARIRFAFPLLASAFLQAAPAFSQRIIPAWSESPPAPPPTYAEVAGLVDEAPLIVDVTVRSAERVHDKDVAPPPPGTARLLVTADVKTLIRGDQPLPARISYVWLEPLDAKGRVPQLRKAHVLLFARAVSGTGDQIQLTRRDAQRNWTPDLDARVRAVVKEVAASDAPPTITGIGHAFHAAGTLPGEGTTQVFLQTSDHRPISLTIERAASGERHWSIALGDIVGAGAPPPPRDILLWFRLACFLPHQLPDNATADANGDDASAAAADYAFVIEQLGSCSTNKPAE